MRYLLADPTLSHRSPGEELARAVTGAGGDVEVTLGVSLPTMFPLAEHRPRYTVRHLLKTATVIDTPVRYLSEARAGGGAEISGTSYLSTPEAMFVPRMDRARLTDVTAAVRLPGELAEDTAAFAAVVDHRVIVRLCTVENEILLQGSADGAVPGLLHLPGLRRRPAPGPLDAEISRAAADVEEMGGSCDALITHPRRYWELVAGGMLSRLSDIGVRVSRTRMISPEQILLGDFRAAVTLLETATSTLRWCRADPAGTDGTGADGTGTVTASLRLGLAVHLPQHFLLLERR